MRVSQSGSIETSRRRKVSWAPDLSSNETTIDFMAFMEQARRQNERRAMGIKLNKPKSRRPSESANERFNSYYDEDNRSVHSLDPNSGVLQVF